MTSLDAWMIVPTYQRPGNVARQIQALNDTHTTLSVIYACDEDDRTRTAVISHCQGYPRADVLVMPGKSSMIEKLNYVAVGLAELYGAVGFMGDDHLPRTTGWDQHLVDAIPGTGLAYPNDLLQGENCPTAVMMSSDIIQTLGYMAPPALVHLYCDNFWLDLGNELDAITYLPHTIVEHAHFSNGKSVIDESYRESNSPQRYAEDKATYEHYRRHFMPSAVAAIRARTSS